MLWVSIITAGSWLFRVVPSALGPDTSKTCSLFFKIIYATVICVLRGTTRNSQVLTAVTGQPRQVRALDGGPSDACDDGSADR
jgi:hypothetical protein